MKSFSRDVITLTYVPLVSQMLGILLTPVLTRMYAPEAFGLAALFGSIVVIPSVFSTMGYHSAIVLPKNNSSAKILLLLCFCFIIFITGISFVITIFVQDIIVLKLNTPSLINYFWLMPIFIFVHGIYQTLRYWKTRFRHFSNLSAARVSEVLGKKIFQISFGVTGFVSYGILIYSELISSILKCLVMMRGLKIGTIRFTKRTYLKLIVLALRYKKFPQFNIWSECLNRIPTLLVSIFFVRYFGSDILGFYGLSLMVLSLPASLLMGSIIEAFIPRVAAAKHTNRHSDLLERLYVPLVGISIFPFVILGIFSDKLFPFVFGEDWVQAGIISQILVIKIFFEIIFSPALSLSDIIGRQELNFIRSIVGSLNYLVACAVGIYFNNFYYTLWTLVLLECALIAVMSGYIMNLINFKFLSCMRRLIKPIAISIILTIALLTIRLSFDLNITILLLMLGVSILLYYGLLLLVDREIRGILKGYLPKIYKIQN